MKLRTGIAAFFYFILFLTSCDENEICDENTRSFLNAGIYTIKDGQVLDSIPADIFVVSLGNIALGLDTGNIHKIPLPLNHELGTTSYLMVLDSVADTVRFNYTTDMVFISYPCGFAPLYSLTSIHHTKNGIDSIQIIANKVEPSDEENIRIFL